MFPAFVPPLTFKPSRDYRLLVVALHTTAIFLLWRANWSWYCTYPLTVGLLWLAYSTVQQGMPHPECVQWVWQDEMWFVYDKHAKVCSYPIARIRYDLGLFMRVDLCSKTCRKCYILFHDQLTAEFRRALYLLQLGQT